MARVPVQAHGAGMAEIVVLLCTGLAFLALLAAVPIEIGEERRDEGVRRPAPHNRRA